MTDRSESAKFIRFISDAIKASDKSQRQIAQDAGFETPNVISMIKAGITKVPMAKIVPLADALGVDRGLLLSLGLRAYQPGLLAVIEEQFGMLVSTNEREWIMGLREIGGGRNPSLTPRLRTVLEQELKSI